MKKVLRNTSITCFIATLLALPFVHKDNLADIIYAAIILILARVGMAVFAKEYNRAIIDKDNEE